MDLEDLNHCDCRIGFSILECQIMINVNYSNLQQTFLPVYIVWASWWFPVIQATLRMAHEQETKNQLQKSLCWI